MDARSVEDEAEVAYLRAQVRTLEDQLRASSTFDVGTVEAPVQDILLEATPIAKPRATVARGRCADEGLTTAPTPDSPVGVILAFTRVFM